jgi:hypothetical protein
MRRRSQFRRRSVLSGIILSLLALVTWEISLTNPLMGNADRLFAMASGNFSPSQSLYIHHQGVHGGFAAALAGGSLHVLYFESLPPSQWMPGVGQGRWTQSYWAPHLSRLAGFSVNIPLWIPFAVLSMGTVFLLRLCKPQVIGSSPIGGCELFPLKSTFSPMFMGASRSVPILSFSPPDSTELHRTSPFSDKLGDKRVSAFAPARVEEFVNGRELIRLGHGFLCMVAAGAVGME